MRKIRLGKGLFICVLLFLVLVMVYSGLRILESTVLFRQEEQAQQTQTKTVIRDGVAYYPRQDQTVILLMGINRTGPVQPTQYNHGGAVDMLTLLVFDRRSGACELLNLNRDLMVDMPALDPSGRVIGSYYGQLAYSHTYGDGMEDSCENVKKTVSDWYVVLLNDIDRELTERSLKTRIVFINYNESIWAPQTERINNPDRFTLMMAPISRTYTTTMTGKEVKLPPFVRNDITGAKDLDTFMAHYKEWRKVWDGAAFAFEYHFWRYQYCDPSGMFVALLRFRQKAIRPLAQLRRDYEGLFLPCLRRGLEAIRCLS